MKIVVIGGAGFIASHVVDHYLAEGHEVVVVDNLSTGKRENLHPDARFYELDIAEQRDRLEEVLRVEQPEVVNIHAAQKSVPKSVEDPLLDLKINVEGLINVLEICKKVDVKKVIFASSGGALAGETDQIPTPENLNPQLISPYAINKLACEKYLHYYAAIFGMKYTVLRYANTFGPRQIPDGDCGVTPIFMNNVLADRPSVLFAYEDMPKGTTRDYLYVGDAARANVLALTKGDDQVLNIGTGIETYTEDLYHVILKVSGKDLPLVREKERTGDVKRSALDSTRAKEVLNWEPTLSLEEGIQKTYDYFLSIQQSKE
jgi:UDP-glucose 4-epimerase